MIKETLTRGNEVLLDKKSPKFDSHLGQNVGLGEG